MERQGVIQIHSPSPYEIVDANTDKWLKHLKSMWPQWKQSPVFSNTLFNFFSSSANPFKAALSIMVSCGDFSAGKQNSLAFDIMQNFLTWVQRQGATEIPKPLKIDAIELVTKQRNMELVKLVIRIFRVKEDKEMFVEHINELAGRKKYKEACQLASYIGLHEYFGINEFVVPLIFQDKYCIVEGFLNDSKTHQLELTQFLDDIIGNPNVMQKCLSVAKNLNIADVKFTFMRYKALSKLLTKLIRTYNLSPLSCPNMNRKRGKGVLHFLLHKRYVEKTIGGDSWSEMVLEAIGDDRSLQEELVQSLTFHRDFKEALAWAERLGVAKEEWPRRLLEYSERGEGEGEGEQAPEQAFEEDWDQIAEPAPGAKVHRFPLEESQIKVIDTAGGFDEFLKDMANGVSIVGIDAEWKPSFGVRLAELALIQVAASHVVYILDVVCLSAAAPQPLWERFASFLFENPNVLKVGFDTRTDLQLVKETLRKLHCLKTASDAGFLDLAVLWRTLMHRHKFVFPFPSPPNASANLSCLIQMCLGESLDKSDQFSNWEKRPLRRSQILYAAIDAYCLLEAYNVIVQESKAQNIPISEVVEEVLYGAPAKKTRSRGGKHYNRRPFRKPRSSEGGANVRPSLKPRGLSSAKNE